MRHQLFSARPVSTEFRTIGTRVKEAIARMTELPSVETELATIYERESLGSGQLRRDEALLEHNPVHDGIQVAITIPFDGDIKSLILGPSTSAGTRSQLWYGCSVTERDHYSKDTPDNQTRVRLTKTFTNPTADEVKAWGKELTDRIEATLAKVNEEIAAANSQLRDEVEAQLKARKATLDAGAGLGDLGTGI